jgi:hypothetical protein
MIDLIRQLHQFLLTDPLSIEDVIARVGPVANDPGGLMPIELEPVLPGVRAANLARNPANGLPYVLTIEPAADAQLTAADLRTAFGDYVRVLTDRGQPPEIIIYPLQATPDGRSRLLPPYSQRRIHWMISSQQLVIPARTASLACAFLWPGLM